VVAELTPDFDSKTCGQNPNISVVSLNMTTKYQYKDVLGVTGGLVVFSTSLPIVDSCVAVYEY
jgi:hypothetical protein